MRGDSNERLTILSAAEKTAPYSIPDFDDFQRKNYGRYNGTPSSDDLTRYFHLGDTDHALIAQKRGEHNRLGFAVQLGTARYHGTFLEDPLAVPVLVLYILAKQLHIEAMDSVLVYSTGEQRWDHAAEIRVRYGYVKITERQVGFRLTHWLYARCWTGTDRPSVLTRHHLAHYAQSFVAGLQYLGTLHRPPAQSGRGAIVVLTDSWRQQLSTRAPEKVAACSGCSATASARAWPTSVEHASGRSIRRPIMVCSIQFLHTIAACRKSRHTGATCCAWPVL